MLSSSFDSYSDNDLSISNDDVVDYRSPKGGKSPTVSSAYASNVRQKKTFDAYDSDNSFSFNDQDIATANSGKSSPQYTASSNSVRASASSPTYLKSVSNDANTSAKKNIINSSSSSSKTTNNISSSSSSNDNNNNDDVGFIPSFLDPSKQTRQRRQIHSGTTTSNSNNSNGMDELDRMLGLSAPSVTKSPRGGKPSHIKISNDKGGNSRHFASDSSDSDDSDTDASDEIKPAVEASAGNKKKNEDTSSTESSTVQSKGKVGSTSSSTADVNSSNSSNDNNNSDTTTGLKSVLLTGAASTRRGLSVTIDVPSTSSISSTPAWLSGSQSPTTSVSVTSPNLSSNSSPITKADTNSNNIIKSLQHKLEASELERDAISRHMRNEIEGLKVKLTASSNGGGRLISESKMNEYEEESIRLIREQGDFRRTISQLEGEIGKLKDEATVRDVKHHDDIKYNKEKNVTEIRDIERKYQQDLSIIEKRHADAVSSLKKLHNDEIQTIRDRAKEGVAFETLTTQIKNASGSIKLIEESMNARYRGIDVMREGQLEARERLLEEMEVKARERVEAAEAEGYRLKGLLTHMEQIISNLRSQSSEEKERLRQEHQRLHTMQLSLESERESMGQRAMEEMSTMRLKRTEIDDERRRLHEERALHREEVTTEKRRLEVDRQEFISYVNTTTKATEACVAKVRDEEERLNRIRDEISREKAHVEQRMVPAINSIKEAERVRLVVVKSKEELAAERAALHKAAQELHQVSEDVERREAYVQEQEKLIASRELAVREGMAQMKSASITLSAREASVLASIRKLEEQQIHISRADNDLVQKRLMMAVAQREMITYNQQNLQPNNQQIAVSQPTQPSQPVDANVHTSTSGTDWIDAFKNRLQHNKSSSSQASLYCKAALKGGLRVSHPEVTNAKELLQNIRKSSTIFQSQIDDKFRTNTSNISQSFYNI